MIGIILASGSSKRLGTNKLLEKINNKAVIEYVVEEAMKLNFTKLLLVYKDKEVYNLFKESKISLIYNDKHLLGQSESIKIGIKNILSDSEPMMFLVGDQPLLKSEAILKIAESYSNEFDIIVPRINGANRMPTVFSPIYKEEFLTIEGDIGGRALIKKHMDKVKFLELETKFENQFLDIDTKENLEFVKAIMKNNK